MWDVVGDVIGKEEIRRENGWTNQNPSSLYIGAWSIQKMVKHITTTEYRFVRAATSDSATVMNSFNVWKEHKKRFKYIEM